MGKPSEYYVNKCLVCGHAFLSTGNNAKYCSDICRNKAKSMREKREHPATRPYYFWEGYEKTREQCDGCIYFRGVCGNYRGCHHLMDTGERRKRAEDGACLSKDTNTAHLLIKVPEDEWPVVEE